MAGQRRERSDAAANRQRILCAARTLLAEHGPDALTMQAVATAAGVGKGTVFHRFGDRDGLTQALIDDYMRAFQDAFLRGPPPSAPALHPPNASRRSSSSSSKSKPTTSRSRSPPSTR
jgi:AcrR family transcriptional regulator